MKEITSTQNKLVKDILQLQEKSKVRKKEQLFIIEGKREILIAIRNGYLLTNVLICFEYTSKSIVEEIEKMTTHPVEFIEISKEVYQKIAYRDSTEGIIAIAEHKGHALSELTLPSNPLIVVLESLEKPGNIGAVLRTADAAGIDAILIANPKTDLYNPNIVRSSVGAIFTNNIAVSSNEEILSFLKMHHIPIYSAILQDAVPYYTVDYKKGAALVMGTEATGLTNEWREASDANIIIPMEGQIDSMNVSVAAAVLIFEAKRQRML